MVWETIVEFDVSRFVAVFHSQVPAEVGPIRSVRPMDPLILAPMHGLLAFSGGQPGILDPRGRQRRPDDQPRRGRPRDVPDQGPGGAAQRLRHADHLLGARRTPTTRRRPAEQFTIARSADRAAAVVAGTPGHARSRSTCRPRRARRGPGTPASGTLAPLRGRHAGDRPRRCAALRGQRRLDHRRAPAHRLRRAERRRRCRPTSWSGPARVWSRRAARPCRSPGRRTPRTPRCGCSRPTAHRPTSPPATRGSSWCPPGPGSLTVG